jgi:Ca2+-transporting ATPase
VEEAEEERTPLEKRLDHLGRRLIWVTLLIGVFVAVAGILAGRDVFLMVETAIALAVAAVPEGLPIVATIALARGMWRMARRNALINRLSAVETLGAANVICTDKTGTLTENRMTVTRIWLDSGPIHVAGEEASKAGSFFRDGRKIDPSGDPVLREALEVGVLCNNASWQNEDGGKAVGDPLEVALLAAGAKGNIFRPELTERFPEEREEAFDPDVKMMATFHPENDRYRTAVKGAPEAVLSNCSHLRTAEGDRQISQQEREAWSRRTNQMAEEGLRVLALATKRAPSLETQPYEGLTLLGLVGMMDPPREDIRPAIQSCRQAGIQVVMVTGDQPRTALAIAKSVALIEEGRNGEVILGNDLRSPEEMSEEERRRTLLASVFARVTPRQKLNLVALYQKNNSIVAMTGDGVNDAPALKKADIGIAMGQRGTQVAREAADMILKDDSFSTIASAIGQGRVIFRNIRKFVLYLLSCNVSEILAVSLASMVKAPLPILPLQILFLNLVTDIFPALALGVGEGDPAVMKNPPRDPREPILTRGHWLAVAGYGVAITIAVLGALALSLIQFGMGKEKAVTVSFLTLAFAQLWHVFNMGDSRSGSLRSDITRNPFVWGALALCAALLLLAVYVPGLASILRLVDPGREGWTLVLGMSLIPLAVGQTLRAILRK